MQQVAREPVMRASPANIPLLTDAQRRLFQRLSPLLATEYETTDN